MPSLFTAVTSEIEGGDTFADASLKPYCRQSRASTIDPGHKVDRRRML
jgi:hypothetical protein